MLSGAAITSHVTSNVAALDLTLSDDDLAQLSTLAESPERYWAARSNLDWN